MAYLINAYRVTPGVTADTLRICYPVVMSITANSSANEMTASEHCDGEALIAELQKSW